MVVKMRQAINYSTLNRKVFRFRSSIFIYIPIYTYLYIIHILRMIGCSSQVITYPSDAIEKLSIRCIAHQIIETIHITKAKSPEERLYGPKFIGWIPCIKRK